MRKVRKALSAILALALVLSCMPAYGMAVKAAENSGGGITNMKIMETV